MDAHGDLRLTNLPWGDLGARDDWGLARSSGLLGSPEAALHHTSVSRANGAMGEIGLVQSDEGSVAFPGQKGI